MVYSVLILELTCLHKKGVELCTCMHMILLLDHEFNSVCVYMCFVVVFCLCRVCLHPLGDRLLSLFGCAALYIKLFISQIMQHV